MSNMILLEPLTLQAGWITGTAAAGFAIGNLADQQPLVAWKAAAAGQTFVTFDLQADRAIDTVFLGFTNADASATWQIRAATQAQGAAWLDNSGSIVLATTQLWASFDALGPRFHAFWHAAAPITARHMRLTLINEVAPLSAGVLALGQAFKPAFNYEWGSGRGLIDLSRKDRLPSGAMAVDARAIVPTWNWTLGDLTDTDRDALWAIARRTGNSRPLLAVEDPDVAAGRHERLHYGTLTDLREYARQAPDKTRWELKIEEWL